MTSIEAKRLAQRIARIEREQANQGKPQLAYSSIENGNLKSYEGNDLKMVVGLQDDGSNTIRHVDGPTPPVPSGLSAHVDGPIVQVSWDGTFESDVTHDWHYLEVLAVGPSNEQLTGTINDLSGGETSLAATSQGDWFITARSVSRAGKRSLDGDAGTVAVQLVGLTGAIDAVQASADGKSTIYYSPTEPVAPDGGFSNGDLWFDTSEEGNNQASVWDGNGWVSMEDARLATIIAAQEELESDLQDVQTSVDGKNKITYDPALPPASYVGVVGDTWYRTSGNSMIGFWKWDGAAWVQQELSTTVIPQIDIGAGTFGSLSGSRLDAYSVTAEKVLIGVGTDLIADGGFNSPIGEGWKIWGGTASVWSIEEVPNGTNYLVCKQGGSGWKEVYSNPPVRVTPGQQYLVSADFRKPEVWASQAPRIAVFTFDGSGSRIASWIIIQHTGDETDWVSLTGSFTVPAGTASIAFVVSVPSNAPAGVEVHVRNPVFRLKSGATLIENGAITTDKLAVGSITAESGVIASLDLGTATVGELDGIRIAAQTIRGQQLSGDAIDGMVITGPTIQSARTGQRWVGDASGIRIFNADNEVRTQLSPDGSKFKGEVEADTLVVNGGSELRSTENKLAQGAKLTLEAGVADPTAPPTVQPYWGSLEFEISSPYTNVGGLVGLAYDGTHYWSAHKDDQGVRGQRARIFAVRIDPDTGVGEYVGGNLVAADAPWPSEVFGVTCVGSELFWLGRSLYDGVVWVTDLDGEYLREWDYPNLGYSSSSPLGYKPGIGNDGTNVVVAQCDDNGPLNVRTYDKTTGALISAAKDGSDLTKSDITGVYVGTADWGGSTKYAAVRKASRSQVACFNATTGVYDSSKSFETATADSTGIVFHDGQFHTLDPAGEIHEYADANTGDASSDWWATYRWSVDVDEDGSNDYVSRIGPVKRFTWPRRGKLKFLGAPLPVGVGYITPSIAKKTTTPTRTEFRTPPFSVYVGESVALLSVLPTDWLSGGSPGDANTFPEAESSVLTTASNTFRLQGDGSGHWGPLKMGRNGIMSGLIVTGSLLAKPDSIGVSKKFTVNLPAGRFAKPPVIWATPSTSVPQNVSVGVLLEDITTNGFSFSLARSDSTTATTVTWFAMDSE